MSITFNITKEGVVDVVNIPGTEISAYLLQKLLAEKLKSKQQDLTLFNAYTGLKINPMEILKDKSVVHLDRLFKSEAKLNIVGIVSNQQLQEMSKKARYFMIKSSNQQNIQKARDHSVWATTYANQDKLRSALLYSPHVFLLFATNRSYEIKGLARMEKEPGKVPEKTFWSGVTNIRLGGNFQIRWIRKQPLTSLQIEKSLGGQLKERIMRLSDGQQIDGELAQKIIQLFEVPTEPYYQIKEQESDNRINNIEPQKKILGLGEILGATKENHIVFPMPMAPPPAANKTKEIQPESTMKKQQKQQQQIKKQSRKKSRKRSSSSSSSSSQYSSSSGSSSSDSESSRSRKKKIKKDKERKKNKHRSRTPKKEKKGKKDRKSKKEKKQKKKKSKK